MKHMRMLKMFKEKIKIWHDKRIQKRGFKHGDQVLLFNSCFKFLQAN
jgi:hypothetical protein